MMSLIVNTLNQMTYENCNINPNDYKIKYKRIESDLIKDL